MYFPAVGYYLTSTQFDELNLKQTFTLLGGTSSIVDAGPLDASILNLYYLRLRAFVSFNTFLQNTVKSIPYSKL